MKKTQLKKIQLKKVNALLAAVLMAAALGVLAPAPAAADPYCGLVWGSLSKTDPAMSQAKVVNVRTGQHYCFDRLVIDLNGPVAGYTVRYVPAGGAGRVRPAGPVAGPGLHSAHGQCACI